MNLTETSDVPDTVMPVEGLSAHLRLGSGFSEDDLQDAVLSSFLRAALSAIEARCGKVLIERDFEILATDWQEIATLPVAPVLSVSKLGILRPLAAGEIPDAGAIVTDIGVLDALGPDRFQLVKDFQSPKLRAVFSGFPSVPANGGVYVAFRAGMASDFSALPPDLQQAVLLLAAHYYENRSDIGLPAGCMPFGVSSLIARYRNVRLGAGI